MLTLLLVDSSIALVPRELLSLRSIIREASRRRKEPSELLLDADYLGGSDLERVRRRFPKAYRPDVVHRSVLAAMDSPAARAGVVDVYLHTVEGRVFHIRRGTRPPRSYRRFRGLMEILLRDGRVGRDERGFPLISEVNLSLGEVVRGLDVVILMREDGPLVDPRDLLPGDLEVGIMVGGFHRGEFSEEVLGSRDSDASIYPEALSSSTVISIVLWEYLRSVGGAP